MLVSMAGSRDVGTLWFWDHVRGYLFVSVAGTRDAGTLWFWDHVRGCLLASVAGTRDVGTLWFFGTTSGVICLFPLPDPGTLEHDSWFQLPDCGVCPYAGGFP